MYSAFVQDQAEAGGAAEETPKKKGWLSGIVGAVKTVGRCRSAACQPYSIIAASGIDLPWSALLPSFAHTPNPKFPCPCCTRQRETSPATSFSNFKFLAVCDIV